VSELDAHSFGTLLADCADAGFGGDSPVEAMSALVAGGIAGNTANHILEPGSWGR